MTNKGGEHPRRMPTSRDVALKAGVSRTVVSYVLNGTYSDHVNAKTRARVLAAIEELNYHPSASARALRQGHSHEIALIPGRLGLSPFVIEVMRGMQDRARQLGYAVIPFLVPGLPDHEQSELFHTLFSRRPAGIVTLPGVISPEEGERAHRQWGITVVYITFRHVEGDLPSICIPLFDVGYMAAQHLLERGHRRLALITPTPPWPARHVETRRSGMGKAVEEFEGARLSCIPMNASIEDARRAAAAWLQDEDRPTGVYGFNDEYAFCFLAALHEQGIRVPEDIALVGTDDTFFCQFSYPPLTSIRFDTQGVGERAVELIDVLHTGKPLPPELASAPTPVLIQRGSS